MPNVLLRRESVVEQKVCNWATDKGILVLKFTPAGQRGWPDRVFLAVGRVAFIEFKAVKDKPGLLQLHRLETLRDHGIPAIWSHDYDESIAFLKGVFYD